MSAVYVAIGTFILINLLIISYRREQQKNKKLNKELNANNEELLKQKETISIKEDALANEKRFRSIFNF